MGYFFLNRASQSRFEQRHLGTFHLIDISSLRKHADHHLDLDRDVFRQ
jgi:hypothetical protein